MAILYEAEPREVGGLDRITVNAVAAFEWAKSGVIVVDFGTRPRSICVTLKGGAIRRGTAFRSAPMPLFLAARPHRVELLALPPRVVGGKLATMQSGSQRLRRPRRLVSAAAQAAGYLCRVIATGGPARLIAPQTDRSRRPIDNLILTGLCCLAFYGSQRVAGA
jgi:type III pantothenate kinase